MTNIRVFYKDRIDSLEKEIDKLKIDNELVRKGNYNLQDEVKRL